MAATWQWDAPSQVVLGPITRVEMTIVSLAILQVRADPLISRASVLAVGAHFRADLRAMFFFEVVKTMPAGCNTYIYWNRKALESLGYRVVYAV